VHDLFTGADDDSIEARLAQIATPQQLRDAIERGIIDATDLGMAIALDQLDGVGLSFDWLSVNTRLRDSARQYTANLITQIDETTRNTVRESVARWVENGEPLDALRRDLEQTGFSPRRAKMIAATETTRASAIANEQAYIESGVVEMVEWRTAMDEIVAKCPICAPLAGRRVRIGEEFAPGIRKPPAHVNCRCGLSPVVEPVASSVPLASLG